MLTQYYKILYHNLQQSERTFTNFLLWILYFMISIYKYIVLYFVLALINVLLYVQLYTGLPCTG